MAYTLSYITPVWVPYAPGTGKEILLTIIDRAIAQMHESCSELAWFKLDLIAGGYLYVLESRQLLYCKLRIWVETIDLQEFVRFQMISYDEMLESAIYNLECLPGRAYQILVHQCQIWISEPGVPRGVHNCFTGGILYVPECDIDNEITDAWWCTGSPGSAPAPDYSWLRNSYLVSSVPLTSDIWSAAYNGVLTISSQVGGGSYDSGSQLRIFPLTPTQGEVDGDFTHGAVTFWDGIPIHHEALMGWGSVDDEGVLKVRGTVYDSFCVTEHRDLDDEREYDLHPWINFLSDDDPVNDQKRSRYLSFYLLSADPSNFIGGSNYAY